MGRDLTSLYISASFAGLTQISGSILTDGTGSNIDNLTITASNATSAVSASYAVVADSAITATSASHAVASDTSISASFATTALSASYVASSSYTPNLQEVTDAGNTTTNSIYIGGRGYQENGISTGDSNINYLIWAGVANSELTLRGDGYAGDGTNQIQLKGSYGIKISGSVSSQNGITAPSFTGSLDGNAATATSASFATTASYAVTASYAENSVPPFPYTGSAGISGSLSVEGTIVSGLGNTSNVVANGGAAIATSGSNADGTLTAVIGGFNNDTGNTQYSVVAGGTNNNIADGQNWSFIGGGENNSVNAGVSAVVGGNSNSANGFKAGVFVGENNTAGGQYSFVAGGNGNNAGTLRSAIIGGENNSTTNGQAQGVVAGIGNIARGDYSFIGGGGGNEIQTTNYGSAIIGGYLNQVQTAHSRSVILGGAGLKTTAENQVVVPTLLISGSGGGVTFPDGTFQTTAGGGGGAGFPYTGSAVITGSLEVTGSQSGLLADNEGISIFASASANTTNGNILIGAQIPTQNNYNTNIGKGNVVIGSGDWVADAAGVLNGAGDFNIVLSGYSGGVNTGLYNTVIGGGNSFIGVSGSGIANSNTRFNTIIGGENQNIDDRATYSGIFAGRNNKMTAIGSNSNVYSVIIGGLGNHISSSDYSAIVGGNSHQMEFANYSGIFAGNNHTFTYGANTSAYSALIGGSNNNMSHIRSVVVGGSFLSSSKDDEVTVPHLTISGSGNLLTFADGTTQATAGVTFPYTGSADISGSIQLVGPLQMYDPTTSRNGINIGIIGQTANVVSGNASAPGVAIGYANTGAFNQHFIIGRDNLMNFQGNGEASYIFGKGNTIGGNANKNNVILGTNHAMASDAQFTIFAGGNSHQLSGNLSNYSGILAGNNNTLAHSQSVILGGDNITTTAHNTAFAPNLCLTGSGATLTFGDGTTQTTAASDPFPYTGSALITGSLSVTGSIGVQSGSFNGFAIDNLTTPTASDAIQHIVALSTAEFAAITPDNNTYYVITDATGATVLENTVVSGSLVGEVSAISIASNTGSMDCSTGNFFTMTLQNAADTHLTATNLQAGQTINLKLTNNATAAGTISFNGSIFEFEGGTPFTATAATSAVDVMTFISFDGTTLQATGLKNFS